MRHLAAALFVIIFSFSVKTIYSQTNITNDYVVISTAEVSDPIPYTNALDAANWENFRLQNDRRVLVFDNGFTIELKSAIELLNLGYPLNLNNYETSLPVGYISPTLKLLPGNIVGMEAHQTPAKTAQ
jgi:hypothetical protein